MDDRETLAHPYRDAPPRRSRPHRVHWTVTYTLEVIVEAVSPEAARDDVERLLPYLPSLGDSGAWREQLVCLAGDCMYTYLEATVLPRMVPEEERWRIPRLGLTVNALWRGREPLAASPQPRHLRGV